MLRTKNRAAAYAAGAPLLLLGVAMLVAKHERTVHFQRLQGAWEGALHFHRGQLMGTQRVVLRVSDDHGSYRASVDAIDLGLKNLPVSEFDFGSSPSLRVI